MQKMEKLFLILVVTMAAAGSYLSCKCLVVSDYTIESPEYRVVHLEADFEIRLYKEMSWMSALVHGTNSFEISTKEGFHRVYQYLHGANHESTQFLMTAPVLTSISPWNQGSPPYYNVSYYVPSKYEKTSPPQPFTELNLQLDKWKSQCIVVRKFPGYASDDNIEKEKTALVSSLANAKYMPIRAMENSNFNYSIAQYNASKHLTRRINEVWIRMMDINVSGFTAEGCPL